MLELLGWHKYTMGCVFSLRSLDWLMMVHRTILFLFQNIINEKIYLVLWFWYCFLGPVSVLYMCYRLITIFFHGIRFSLLYRKVGLYVTYLHWYDDDQVRRKYDDDIRRCLEYVLAKGQIGDWFVLYQLSKNCNPYFYREFIRELAMELSNRPKRSSYRGSSIGRDFIWNIRWHNKYNVKERALLGDKTLSLVKFLLTRKKLLWSNSHQRMLKLESCK